MKAIIIGYGKMGKQIESILEEHNHHILAVFNDSDIEDLALLDEKADVVMDFSSPSALAYVAPYIKKTGAALVSGTTGYSDLDMRVIQSLRNYAPIMYSANFSLGIAVFKKALAAVSKTLMSGGFDVELVETHHNQKTDAPSGTAKALLGVLDPDDAYLKVYGRSGLCGSRTKKEIGVHSMRGGTTPGEHAVIFLGKDEKFEIRHTATSRKIFAAGAVNGAEKIWKMEKGFYIFDEIMVK